MKIRDKGMPGQFRHGDVLLERVGDVPEGTPIAADAPTLAEGEISGHSHRFFGGALLFRDDALARSIEPQLYIGTVDAPAAAELRHVNRDGSLTGEHDTIKAPAARYTAIAQREYTPEGERRAQD